MDNLLAMRVFARVVESGSYTRAAESLRMPLATVSKLVQDLEGQLGVKLLQRNMRSLAMTPDGADYYERTGPIIQAVDEVQSHFATGKEVQSGKLRVNSGAAFASYVLIPALASWFDRFPGIEIDLRIDDRPTDMIKEGIDCAIRGGPMHDASVVARNLGGVSWVTCASPEYLKKFGTPKHPDELREHRVIRFISARTGLPVPFTLRNGDHSVEVDPTGPLSVNEGNAQLAAGLAGLGIIHSLSFKLHAHVANGDLVPILPNWQAAPYPYSVVYPFNRHVNERLRLFVAWLGEVFQPIGSTES